MRDELAVLGCAVSGHPLRVVADRIPPDAVGAAELAGMEGRRVRVAGHPAADDVAGPRLGRGPTPADRSWVTAYDAEDGLVDALVPDAVVQRLVTTRAGVPREPVLLSGTVRRDGGHTWLDVDAIDALERSTSAGVA